MRTTNKPITPNIPKMSRRQAKILWNSLTWEQRQQFNHLIDKMERGELTLNKINVDDNEQVQTIVLEPKEKPSAPITPYAKHFKQDK